MESRQLCLAAVQMISINSRVDENLTKAAYWAGEAASQGADLVLLPELFSIGFELNANTWNCAEPQGGKTEDWLTETAKSHVPGPIVSS